MTGRMYVLSDGAVRFLDGLGPMPTQEEMEARHQREKERDAARDPRAIAFGLRMRGARLAHLLTLREIERRTGISPVEYCHIEQGRRFPTEEEREKLCEMMPELKEAAHDLR